MYSPHTVFHLFSPAFIGRRFLTWVVTNKADCVCAHCLLINRVASMKGMLCYSLVTIGVLLHATCLTAMGPACTQSLTCSDLVALHPNYSSLRYVCQLVLLSLFPLTPTLKQLGSWFSPSTWTFLLRISNPIMENNPMSTCKPDYKCVCFTDISRSNEPSLPSRRWCQQACRWQL